MTHVPHLRCKQHIVAAVIVLAVVAGIVSNTTMFLDAGARSQAGYEICLRGVEGATDNIGRDSDISALGDRAGSSAIHRNAAARQVRARKRQQVNCRKAWPKPSLFPFPR